MRTLALIILLGPLILTAEVPVNGAAGNASVRRDSVESLSVSELEAPLMQREIRQLKPDNNNPNIKPVAYDWKKDGLFQALFHVGLNLSQIDGDTYWGYTKFGFDGGIGAMVRFHKYFSVSMELGYTMWGANANLVSNADKYRVNANYVQVPISLNVHDKEIVMFSAGVNLGYLVSFSERNEIGNNILDSAWEPQPKKFDLDAFASVHFLIKKQFGIGLKFSYSMLPFRSIEPQYASTGLTRIRGGEYNNVLTIRFMYILKAWKRK